MLLPKDLLVDLEKGDRTIEFMEKDVINPDSSNLLGMFINNNKFNQDIAFNQMQWGLSSFQNSGGGLR